MKLLIFGVLFASSVSFAKNYCSCVPTTGKDYIGDARQRSAFGYTIHWVCDYDCRVQSGEPEVVKGTYKKFYAGKTEKGTEGICEGMKYEPHFYAARNDYVYMWDGKVRSFDPKKSSSEDLKSWATKKECK